MDEWIDDLRFSIIQQSNHPIFQYFNNLFPQNKSMATKDTFGEGEVWEVFIQKETGAPHEHAGSIHAADPEIALQNARDVFARRGEVVSIWVVPANSITASSPDDSGPFFDPANDKIYRHPQFYHIPKSVKGM